MSLNKVQLIGFLGKDPELKQTQTGMSVANFSVATTERFTGKDGQNQERTEWHRIVAWNKTAENCAQYLKKGSQVYIEGKNSTRKWTDKNGVERYTTEVVAFIVQFLDRKEKSDGAKAEEFSPPPAGDDDVPF